MLQTVYALLSRRASVLHQGIALMVSIFIILFNATVHPLPAQRVSMVNPSIDDPRQPFSYFSKPTDVIGWMDAPAATEITPEGFLFTGFGELMFFIGENREPLQARIRTLQDGYLPIDTYAETRGGIGYRFEVFEASLDGTPDGTMVNFVRVTVTNTNDEPTRATLTSGIRYEAPMDTGTGISDNRFRRPAHEDKLGGFSQPGEDFNSDWSYGFGANDFTRDGKTMYLFPAGYVQRSMTLDTSYNLPPDLKPRKLQINSVTPVGVVEYSKVLAPHAVETLDFKMPLVPTQDASTLTSIGASGFDEYKAKTALFWKNIVQSGAEISVPETKVNDTYNANLIYLLIARDKINSNYIQTVNKFQYHQFFIRDSAVISHMYDLTGYPLYSRQVLDFFPRWQQPDGNFLSQPQEYDAWGETLWAYGEHYRLTGDMTFAKAVFPSIERAVQWLKVARASDPLHLIPASNVKDNEDIEGHITGYNLLALGGLKEAIHMADSLGKAEDTENFRQEYRDYEASLMKVLNPITAKDGGYLPPALDGDMGGQDWGNMLGVYPEKIFDPQDPPIAATVEHVRSKFQEGLVTYDDGEFLHHYLTLQNMETELLRGDDRNTIQDLYAVLLHTASTHTGFEFAIHTWGDRDFQDNLAPHGWFSAEYRIMLRNMLLREDDQTLHLLSALSPEWIGAGKTISIHHAPTEFGTVDLNLEQQDNMHATLHITSNWSTPPSSLVLHLPWFMHVESVTAGNKTIRVQNQITTLPAATREVHIRWLRSTSECVCSYASAVEAYKTEYAHRYAVYMHGSSR